MWIWRRMEKINWTEPITNEEVLTVIGEERAMIQRDKGNRLDTYMYLEEIRSYRMENGGKEMKRKTKTDHRSPNSHDG